MTFFENILKKRLGDATSTKGVVPDDLWAEIERELPPEDTAISTMKWHNLGLAILGVAVAVWLALSITLSDGESGVSDRLPAETINEESPVPPSTVIQKKPQGIDAKEKDLSGKIDEQITVKDAILQGQQDEMRNPDLPVRTLRANIPKAGSASSVNNQAGVFKIDSQRASDPDTRSILANQNINQIAPNDTPSDDPPLSTTDAEKYIENLSENNEVVGSVEAPQKDAAHATNSVKMLDFVKPEIARLKTREAFTAEHFTTIVPVKQLRRPRAVLGVFVGTNLLRHRYPSSTADDLGEVLNATRGEALGQSAALEFGYRLRPGLKVYTGVELAKTHTTFRYTEQWDTVTMWNGREVDAIATRRVQHNNRQTLVSVPLMLEKTFALGRVEAGIAAGLSLNYLTQQTGRSLNALQQVVTYSSGSRTNLPTPNFYLAYQMRPSVNYRLNNRISLQARADLRWQRYGKSALYDLSANARLYGGSLGVVFGL